MLNSFNVFVLNFYQTNIKITFPKVMFCTIEICLENNKEYLSLNIMISVVGS